MAFFNSAVTVLQTLVIALGAGLGIWGAINLLEGYGNDNPGAKSQGMKQLMAGGGVALIGTTLVPLLSGLLLSKGCRSEDSDRAAKAACYIVRCRQSPQLAIFCALWQVHMLEVWRRTAV